MGVSPSDQSSSSSSVAAHNLVKDQKYGGLVQLSPHTGTVYQILHL